MSTDWKRVRQLVEAALERAPEEQAAFVENECGADTELRDRVLALLAAETSAADLPTPPGAAFADAAPERSDRPDPFGEPAMPARLGPWELRRQLGAGGMGSVYLAVRADGQFQRQVAVKVIRNGLDRRDILARFQRERQVQANLDHPGIARMLDAGIGENGEPYLVLEYVEGIPIDRHCDENRLSAEERIELFRRVCDAVHHAHQNLVVHRDLKPNNILVTPAGEPKLLDFGIAKVLDPEKAAGVEVTQAFMRFMTPTYASPEQVRNRPVTTASDIYSLGVILYQLLTGHPPLDLGTSTPAEIERVVCEVDPPRPSTVVTRTRDTTEARGATAARTPELVSSQRLTTPRGLARALTGDLDSIVLMAMRKEPHRRYPSAADLAEDLRRCLAGLPVKAQPDTALYRASKFVRRNKLAVLAGGLVLVSLVGGLVLTRRAQQAEAEQRRLAEENARQLALVADDLALEKRRAEQRAESMRELAEELEGERAVAQQRLEDVRSFATTLIFDIGQRIVALEGATAALQILCETGVQFLDKLERDAGEDASLLRALAIAYARLGEVQAQGPAGRPGGEGTEVVLRSIDRGVELARRAQDLEPADARNAYALATCLTYRARVQETLWLTREAEDALREAIEVCELEIGPAPDPKIGHLFTWWMAIEHLSDNLRIQLRDAEADELIEPARDVFDRLHERWPDFPAVRSAEVKLASWSSDIAWRRGEPESAVEHAERAVELQEAIVRERPVAAAVHELWKLRLRLASRYGPSVPPAELIATVDEARRHFEASVAADPKNLQTRFELIQALQQLAALHAAAGDYPSAREIAAQGAGVARRQLEANPDDPTVRFLLVGALLQGASVARQAGSLSEARELATEARVLAEDALLREDRRRAALQLTWQAHAALGRILRATAADERAEEGERRAAAAQSREWFDKALAGLDALQSLASPSAELRLAAERLRAELDELAAIELALD